MERKKERRKRRAFTPKFKTEAVRLCKVSDRTIEQVAGDLDVTTAEREELARLRRENKRLTIERDILKAAATFFAKESE